jgi:hypothetical protein
VVFKILFVACTLIAAFCWTAAHAATGNDIRTACQSYDPAQPSWCLGWLLGAAEALAADGEICVANGTQGEQFRIVFLRAVDADPSRWNVPAILLAVPAFKQAWPCQDGREARR